MIDWRASSIGIRRACHPSGETCLVLHASRWRLTRYEFIFGALCAQPGNGWHGSEYRKSQEYTRKSMLLKLPTPFALVG
eukprot:4227783-Amphidinium_carterae.1